MTALPAQLPGHAKRERLMLGLACVAAVVTAISLAVLTIESDSNKATALLIMLAGFAGMAMVGSLALFMPRLGFVIFVIWLSIFVQLRYYVSFAVGPLIIMPVGILLGLLFLAALIRTPRIVVTGDDLLLLLFVVVCALPLIWALDRDMAILGYEQAIVEPFLAYCSVRLLFRGEQGIRLLLIGMGGSFLVLLGYLGAETLRAGGLSAIISGNTSRIYGAVTNIFRGGYGEPIAVATISLYIWPVFVFALALRRQWASYMFGLLAWTLPLIVVITISRQPLGILLFLIGVMLYWAVRFGLLSLKMLVVLCVAGGGVALIIAPPYIYRFTQGNGVVSDPAILGGRPLEISALRYVAEHIGAVRILQRYPLGIGAFNGDYYWQLYNPSTVNFRWSHIRIVSIFVPYLEVGIHFGWLALAVFGVYLLRLLKATYRLATRGGGMQKYIGAGLFSTLLANGLLGSMGIGVSWKGLLEDLPVNAFAIWAFMIFALVAALKTIPGQLADRPDAGLRHGPPVAPSDAHLATPPPARLIADQHSI